MVLLLKRVITIAMIQTNPKIPTVNSDMCVIPYTLLFVRPESEASGRCSTGCKVFPHAFQSEQADRSLSELLYICCKLIILNLSDYINDGAVTGLDDTDNAVIKLYRIRCSDHGICLVTKLLDRTERKINILHALDEILSSRVDGDSVVCDNNVNGLTRGRYRCNICTDCRDSSLK